MAHHTRYPLWPLALSVALLPLLTIHFSYLLSALEGHVPWCIPHWDSCTSISRTGRFGSAYFLFKGAMIPVALLMIFFWWFTRHWLQQLGASGRSVRLLPWIGLVAALSLLLYTLALGHVGDGYRLIRRVGVVFAFALTYLAQLLTSASLLHTQLHRWGRYLLLWALLTLLVGLSSLLLDALWPELWKQVDDAFEWNLALLINAHALVIAWLWYRSGYSMQLGIRG